MDLYNEQRLMWLNVLDAFSDPEDTTEVYGTLDPYEAIDRRMAEEGEGAVALQWDCFFDLFTYPKL